MISINFLLNLLVGVSVVAAGIPAGAPIDVPGGSLVETVSNAQMDVPNVPFYSQFYDIHAAKWQKLGCGIVSVAMLIEFYRPGIVSVDTLLKEGIDAGAFINGAGWTHKGLALLAQKYDLEGMSYDLSNLDKNAAFAQFERFLKEGPVIASVYYKLEPTNPIPHLIVINGINNGMVYYNDPASASGGKNISIQNFIKAWKKRFIVVRSSL